MSRAIDLRLAPAAANGPDSRLEIQTYTYAYAAGMAACLRESVTLSMDFRGGYISTDLTPDEARALAGHLLQVADLAQEHRERRESLDDITEQLRDPDFDSSLCTFVHPDVVYVEPGELCAGVAEHPGKLVIARPAAPDDVLRCKTDGGAA